MTSDTPLSSEPGLPTLTAARALLPADLANFSAHNWHWASNPVETRPGAVAGTSDRRGTVRTIGLTHGNRRVIHAMGIPVGAELVARETMRTTLYVGTGAGYETDRLNWTWHAGESLMLGPMSDALVVGVAV
jgi:hypothetical protein